MRVVVEQAGDAPDHLVVILDHPFGHVVLVIRTQQLVDLSQGTAGRPHPVDRLEPGQKLARLAQRARRIVDQPLVHSGDLQEILSHRRILLPGRHLPRPVHVLPHPLLHPQHQRLFAVVEGTVLRPIEIAVVANLSQQSPPAQLQTDAHVRPEVVHAADAGVDDIVFPVQFAQMIRPILRPPTAHTRHPHLHPGPGQSAHRVDIHRMAL